VKIAVLVFAVIAAAALSFGAWGRFSDAGKVKYDEMAGIIPFLSWYAGIFFAVLALGLGVYVLFRGN
jgi:hypothetical protein